jgi:hypothetical protein
MRVSLNWLKELVDVNLTPEELGKILTIAGFELEEIIGLLGREGRSCKADGRRLYIDILGNLS